MIITLNIIFSDHRPWMPVLGNMKTYTCLEVKVFYLFIIIIIFYGFWCSVVNGFLNGLAVSLFVSFEQHVCVNNKHL